MRVFLITGASSGIGAATARAVAAPDTAIALHARKNLKRPRRRSRTSSRGRRRALILEGDLAQPGDRRRAWSTRRSAQFGQLDVVVSNAGFADRRPIGEVDRAAWDASSPP